jgi:hypothetical protein
MDMVGESLRKNNSLFTMSECPSHLPSFYDGLAQAVLNYIWRTNDIVYLGGAPRSLFRGQFFPVPMWEKNGSRDAFRFFIHRATGGSDHICFNNPAVAVPGIEYFTWPDQWYHTDTDTPDKADSTEMKRVAFLGAATAWAAAQCSDDVAAGLLEAASDFGYRRIAERELAPAIDRISAADAKGLAAAVESALNLVRFGVKRETAALRSVEEISTGSPSAKASISGALGQWEVYGRALKAQVLGAAALKAKRLGVPAPEEPKISALKAKYAKVVPSIAPAVKGREFAFARFEGYDKYLKAHPDALKGMKISTGQISAVLNFVNGRSSVAEIRDDASAELDADLPLEGVAAGIDFLVAVGYLTIGK